MKIKKEKGFTGIDITIAIVIFIIFISIVTVMFSNVSKTSKEIKRKSEATQITIRAIETMKNIDFEELVNTLTIEDIERITAEEINLPNGYELVISVDDSKYPDAIKIITAEVRYKNGKNFENIKIETLVKNTDLISKPKGIFVTLYTDGTLGFDNKDELISGKEVMAGPWEITGSHYTENELPPWNQYKTQINSAIILNKIVPDNTSYWFKDCNNIKNINNIQNIDASEIIDMSSMFAGCSSLTQIDLSEYNIRKCTSIKDLFCDCVNLEKIIIDSTFNTSSIENMQGVFARCTKLNDINLEIFNTKNATTMFGMFWGCNAFTSLDLSNFDTSNVTNMSTMFYECKNLNSLNISKFDTSNVTDMSSMFSRCSSLKNINLTTFDTRNVTTMFGMFYECSNLESLDLSTFNTEKVQNMNQMFCRCSNLSSINVSGFNTLNVTDMYALFYGCSKLKNVDLTSFNTKNTKDMHWMFVDCSSLVKVLVSRSGWITSQANTSSMFLRASINSVTYV